MTARSLRRSEGRLAAEHLARAEVWVDQIAPELQAEIARIRAEVLHRADSMLEPDQRDSVTRSNPAPA